LQNPETHLCLQIRTGHCSINKQQVFLINLLYRKKLLIFQRTLVPKLTLGTFLTLSVGNGHKLKDWVFGIPAYIQSKVDNKNFNQYFIKHDKDNNSQF